MASDKNYLQNPGEAAYERTVNNFTLGQHMQGLRKIYSEVLAFNSNIEK